MNCKHVNNLLSPYLDNELPVRDHAQVQAHLAICSACAANLQTLQSAVAWLQADVSAQSAETASMPDLYGAFQQRLVTQSARTSTLTRRGQPLRWLWLVTRVALPIACVLAVVAGFQLHAIREAAARREALRAAYKPQEELAEALLQPYAGSVHVVEVRHGDGPGYSRSVLTTEQWLSQGYHMQTTRSTEGMVTRIDKSGRGTVISPTQWETTDYYTPGGVRLSWMSRSQPNALASDVVSLFWEPQDPELHQAIRIQDIAPFSITLKPLANPGHPQNNGLAASAISERIGNQTFRKLTFTSTALVVNPTPWLTKSHISMPGVVNAWVDENHRLRRCVQIFTRQDGTQWNEDIQITYGETVPNQLFAPHLPEGKRVVQGHYSFNYDAGVLRLPDSPVKVRNPVWLTMPGEDKRQIEDVITQFGAAWGAHDLNRLGALVDTERPLEITRPERRRGLTGEDVWQQVWVNRLAQEPQKQDYRILPDFAYQVDDPLLNAVPFDISKIPNDLPFPGVNMTGLNVLAWVKARQVNGTTNSYSAQLYLVKRPEGWKIFQFARGTYCVSDILSQVDRETSAP